MESYRLSKLQGISPSTKSFNFKLIHTLLPSNERVNHLNPNATSLCRLNCGAVEDYHHLFFQCQSNHAAADALLRCVRSYDSELTDMKSLSFRIKVDGCFEMAVVSILSSGLELIWSRRLQKKNTDLIIMRSELEWASILRRKSRNRVIKEAGEIMINMIENFF